MVLWQIRVSSAASWVSSMRCSFALAAESTSRISTAQHVLQPLSTNLHELHSMLSDDRVGRYKAFADKNQYNFKQLLFFLKGYTANLSKKEPVPQQRHVLEFVLPGTAEDSRALRRVVCTLNTTDGGNCHRIVHRTLQGLFAEVGLSPNFLWDDTYAVPVDYLSYIERSAIQNAELEQKVKAVQAVQRGEALPEGSGMSVVNADTPREQLPEDVQRILGADTAGGAPSVTSHGASLGGSAERMSGGVFPGAAGSGNVQAGGAAGGTCAGATSRFHGKGVPPSGDFAPPDLATLSRGNGAPATSSAVDMESKGVGKDHCGGNVAGDSEGCLETGREDEEDHREEDAEEDPEQVVEIFLQMARDVDTRLGLLAMSPYVLAYGGERAAEEERIARDNVSAVNTLLPGLGPAVERVWQGERNAAELAQRVALLNSADQANFIQAAVQQLVSCTQQLEDQFGQPSQNSLVSQKLLARCVEEVRVTQKYFQDWLEQDLDTEHIDRGEVEVSRC